MISVLVPSRNRSTLLAQSLEFMVGIPEIEILVWVDDDDPELDRYKDLADSCGIKLLVSKRQGYKNFHVMVNVLADRAKGDWLLLWNDDAIVKTFEWYKIIEANDSSTPKVLNFFDPGNPLNNLFPLISRPMLEAMGYFSMSTHCDSWVQDIANDLKIHVPVYDIQAIHTRDIQDDQTRTETQAVYRETSPEYDSPLLQELREQDKEKIRQWIQSHSKQSV